MFSCKYECVYVFLQGVRCLQVLEGLVFYLLCGGDKSKDLYGGESKYRHLGDLLGLLLTKCEYGYLYTYHLVIKRF